MFSQRNISYVLIGKDLGATSQTRAEELLNGEVAISNVFGSVLSSGTGVDRFMIHQGGVNGKPARSTDVITAANITSVSAKAYAAGREQIDFIGYNGSSGSITAANEKTYTIRMNFVYGDRGQEFPQQNFINVWTTSDSSATQSEIVQPLVKDLASTARKRYERDFKAEITSDGTLADFTGTATMLKFTKDSKTVSFVTSAGAASTGTVAAGDLIQVPSQEATSYTFTANILGTGAGRHLVWLGNTLYNVADAGSAAQNADAIAAAINAGNQATATVSTAAVTIVPNNCSEPFGVPVVNYTADDSTYSNAAITINSGNTVPVRYVVASSVSSAASFELTVAFQGETQYAVGGTTATTQTGVVGSVTNYGIKITGLKRRFNVQPGRRYRKSRWVTTIKNFGSTAVTNSQTAYLGCGTWEQVAEEDLFGDIVLGNKYRGDIHMPRNLFAETCGQYGCVTITWSDLGNQVIGPRMSTQKQARIFFNDATSGQATEFLTTLGEIMSTSYSFA